MPFLYRLETAEGEPADPPTLSSAVPNWRPGDMMPLGDRTANLFSNTVSVIDGATDSVIDTEPVGACPAGAGVNTSTNRVYVSNLCDNTVTVLTRN